MKIKYKAPGSCPVCGHDMIVTTLSCDNCSSRLEGYFSTCRFCQMPEEQLDFVITFIRCRGNIKDVEKELGISYPTVRSRLDAVIEALGYGADRTFSAEDRKQGNDILEALERGEITPEEAVKQLKKKR